MLQFLGEKVHIEMKEKCFLVFDTCLFSSLCGLLFAISVSKAGIEIFFFLSLLFFIAKKILKPDLEFLKNKLYIFLFLFLFFSALSFNNSAPYQITSLQALLSKWFKNLLIFTMFYEALREKKQIRYAFFIFIATSFFIGIDGLIQRGLGYDLLWQRPMMYLNNGALAITAAFTHYNSFGAYLLFPLAFVSSFMLQKENRRSLQIGFFLLAILLGLCLLLTFSRGAWVGFFALLLFTLFLKQERFGVVLLLFFFVFVLIIPFFRMRLLAIFMPGGDSSRFILWNVSWRMIKENPFVGKGIGTFMQRFTFYAPNVLVSYAHNCYLQIWAETGIFSLLSFFAFLGILFFRGIRAFRLNNDYYLLGVMSGLFGFLVHSFFDNQFYTLHLSALFWAMAGLFGALIQTSTPNSEKNSE